MFNDFVREVAEIVAVVGFTFAVAIIAIITGA